MASSSSTVSVFDAHRFRTANNEQLFDSYARRRKVIPKAGFNLEDDEYSEIMEQIAQRGWRRLAAPRTDISKFLVQEFYANAAMSDEEAAAQEEFPYKSFVRGKETRQALNQRLDEVLADLCIPGASWKLSSSQPPVPSQLRRTELQPLARGWQEFIIHSLVPTGNKLKITTSRAIQVHTIIQGEDVRAEEIIAENMKGSLQSKKRSLEANLRKSSMHMRGRARICVLLKDLSTPRQLWPHLGMAPLVPLTTHRHGGPRICVES
ncbi:hypothetical protein PIB30_085266 [Stylosanthes scabra]|uniref:Putative plant transposon protein domain-containing protein n=1 Tax=Stylosanthes scabra TaxID=79078 RepID=A0ABU6WSK2_9FABA|nr:hypothetical protein [Stylosanthes scabra]